MGWVFATFLFLFLWLWACRNAVPALALSWWDRVRRACCTYPRKTCRGRPPIGKDVIDLIRLMSRENPMWGAPRIHGELLRLGFRIAQSTVSKYMPSRSHNPAPNWKVFLASHADVIVAIDMMTVFTAAREHLYVLVVLDHKRRRILHTQITAAPTALWLARQVVEAFPGDQAPIYLVRDNDKAYGETFRRQLRGLGIEDRPITPYSPWQNGYVERVIGSIRRECLNHFIPLNAWHVRRRLNAYVEYYNNDRTHLGLGKDSPNSRPIEPHGEITSRPILNGLHHRYFRKPRK